jgi:hypothetical protein
MSRQLAMWTLAALLGIVLTAGVTWATNRLTSQHIGISSEPISAGARLAPPTAERTAKRRSRPGHRSKAGSHRATPQGSPGPVRGTATEQVPSSSQSSPVEQSSPSGQSTSAPATGTRRAPGPRTSSSSGDDHTDRGGESEGARREPGGESESSQAGHQRSRDD